MAKIQRREATVHCYVTKANKKWIKTARKLGFASESEMLNQVMDTVRGHNSFKPKSIRNN